MENFQRSPNSRKLADYYRNDIAALKRYAPGGKDGINEAQEWAYYSGKLDGADEVLNEIFGIKEQEDNAS